MNFDDVFEENYGFYIDDSCKYRYANSKEFGKAMYKAGQQSQQSKIDELQGRVNRAIIEINLYLDSDGMEDITFSDIKDVLDGDE